VPTVAGEEKIVMTKFLVLFRFKSETIDAMLDCPSDRAAAVTRLAELVGGKLDSYYWMFGNFDGYATIACPTSAAMAAISLAVASTGAFEHVETHELIDTNALPDILRRAKELRKDYVAPGAKIPVGV
jgi:uncharacterized protein with GYD domain